MDEGQIKLWAAILALGNTLIQILSSKKSRRIGASLFKKTISVPRGISTILKNDYRVAYVRQVFENQYRISTEVVRIGLKRSLQVHKSFWTKVLRAFKKNEFIHPIRAIRFAPLVANYTHS
ncbi:MAG TPA: hypothetical protein VGJ00_07825 [Rhabdochlamydiaceae bacterium]|jgi:hypothetical protein